uniref:Integrase catalytic domain-containing protein n=1 Tax=Tanacetum cinerariifolium TaxID=118510 RepID=A0A6L2NQA6_TANCI|nr:hypothetical protein [Tanacetum cinerariifolium]
MEHSNTTPAKNPILDTGKFKQWKFRIHQYLLNEHYALWEVIEFRDSYEVPKESATTGSASDGKKGRTVAITTEDMQKRRNDVKARNTLLLALPDKHQLRFSKYKTAQELWAAILKTFGGNDATRKTKKNLLKQQYGNFKAEGKETLEQTFNRLQQIISQLEFMDVEIEQDDLNQKLLTSLALEWLMHTIMWRNRSDLDTMSLDDLYNHLKVYEPKVQKKSDYQNMAFISSSKNSSGNEEDNTASVPTASTQIKHEDINQIDEDDIEEMDIKWNMALLSMMADRFWKKTRKKIFIQGTYVVVFDKSKAPKDLIAIDEVRRDWSYIENDEENHALVADEEAPTEFALMANTSTDNEVFDNSLYSKACRLVEFKNQEIKFCEKIRGLEFSVECKANRIENLTNELETLKKEKEGLESKLTGLPEFVDDTITDYTRPSPSIESNPNDLQNNSSFASENGESTGSILSKPEIIFIKSADSPTVVKTDKKETVRKPTVKYVELYRKTLKRISWAKNSNANKSTTPITVFYKTGRPMRTNRPYMNAAQPKRTSFYKPAHSYLNRPFQRTSAVRSQFRGPRVPTVNRKFPTVNRNFPTGNSRFSTADVGNKGKAIKPQHMTDNISYLSDYEPYDGGYVSFGQSGCKITGKGTIKTDKLEFENVYFVKDSKYNLFSVSQICDNKNSVLFTDSECIVLGRNFKLSADANVLLRTLRQHNMYSIDLNNVIPHTDLTCWVAKASADECMLWHRRLGKQHKASCKTKLVNSVTKPIHTLHMDLFGHTSDETSGILKNFITEIENLKELRVKIIRCDNRGEFRNKEMNDFCSRKGIKREFSNAKTPQQNGVAKRRNKTLIEAARTMLADAKLPVTFWAEAANTACTNSTNFSGIKEAADQDVKKHVSSLRYIVLLNWFHEAHLETSTSNAQDACNVDAPESSRNFNPTATSTNPPADHIETLAVETLIPTVSSPVLTACLNDSPEPSSDTRLISKRVTSQDDTPSLDNILILTNRFEDILGVTTNTDDTNGVEADLGNMEENISASPTPTLRIHKDHPKSKIIGPVDTPVQTRTKSKEIEEQSFIATIHQKTNPNVWSLVDCPKGVIPIGTKWVLKNKNDERRIVIRNKSRLVAQGHTQEEGIDYDKLFAHVARIKAIRLFLAYASLMGFTVYQMDLKSAFLYGTIDEEVYVMQPPGFQDPEFPARVYKVEKAMYGLYQALKAWHQMTPKECHMHAVKRIFRYLKGHPKLGLWYPKESPFDLVAYSDSDYGGVIQDRKSTTKGCQFLGRRLISWQCKKQTIVATSTTEAEYVATLKARVRLLEDREGGDIAHSGEDAPIKGRSLDEEEEAAAERSTERGSDDTKEMVNVLTSLDAAKILTSGGVQVSISLAAEFATANVSIPTGSGSIPTASPPGTGVPTGSGMVPTASPIFTTATESTPYTRRKGKEKMVESDTPKKKKLQEQIDVQVKREFEEEMARDAQRMNEQIARDAEIARIHTEEELQMMIDGLDRNNETIAKYLQEYHQFVAQLPIGRRIELISDLVKYQDNYAKLLKFQTQQRKPLLRKQQKDFYMSVLRSHAGWKAKHFKGMTLEEIKEKFDPVWKQMQDFIPIGSKEESERFNRKGLRLEQDIAKKFKTSEEVPEEKLKEMMELIPVEEVYVEALQVKHLIIDWEVHTEGERSYWKIIRLEGSTTSYQFFVDLLKHFDREDLNQL